MAKAFTTLSLLMRSGIPWGRALDVVSRECIEETTAAGFRSTLDGVLQGMTFHAAAAKGLERCLTSDLLDVLREAEGRGRYERAFDFMAAAWASERGRRALRFRRQAVESAGLPAPLPAIHVLAAEAGRSRGFFEFVADGIADGLLSEIPPADAAESLKHFLFILSGAGRVGLGLMRVLPLFDWKPFTGLAGAVERGAELSETLRERFTPSLADVVHGAERTGLWEEALEALSRGVARGRFLEPDRPSEDLARALNFEMELVARTGEAGNLIRTLPDEVDRKGQDVRLWPVVSLLLKLEPPSRAEAVAASPPPESLTSRLPFRAAMEGRPLAPLLDCPPPLPEFAERAEAGGAPGPFWTLLAEIGGEASDDPLEGCCRALALGTAAGLPRNEICGRLAASLSRPDLREAIQRCSTLDSTGPMMSDVLVGYPGLFAPSLVALIREDEVACTSGNVWAVIAKGMARGCFLPAARIR